MVRLVEDRLHEIRALCVAHGVGNLFLIGSATGAGFDPSRSDIDFLVEFEPFERTGPESRYFNLLAALEALLNRPVHLVERNGVENPFVRASMERSKVRVYAAA